MESDSAARRSQQLAVVSSSAEAAAVDIAPPASGLAASPPAAIVVAAPAAAQPPLPEIQVPEEDERLEPWLAHVSVLVHLATFAIIGVLIRYGLEVLFGPEVAHVTDDEQTVFIDLPANIAGSFIMGVVGVAAKRHIAAYSEHLAIGLATGLCGCITTFASWNQRMLAILASGLWVRALAGYIVGACALPLSACVVTSLLLCACAALSVSVHSPLLPICQPAPMFSPIPALLPPPLLCWHAGAALPFVSLMAGIDFADGIKWQIKRANDRRTARGKPPLRAPRSDHFDRRWASLLLFFCLSVFLVTAAAIGTALDDWSSKTRRLWFACVVAAPGAWLRWYLSWLNGGAVGKGRWWQWVPVGTVAANVSASVLEAALSTVVLAYNSVESVLAVGAIQLGFLGSLSTVSTLMVEVLALHKAKTGRCWRPYFYLYGVTILPSFLLGILVYCVPVWVLDYTSKYNHL
ncbi:unnamed protein product [Closterium sp. Naga37s-1]|nr:unnamed protein product [Closterium sp. Naga37s-1]